MASVPPRFPRRAAALLATVLACAVCRPLPAQDGFDFSRQWSWDQLQAQPGVSAAEVEWLRENVPAAQARELLSLVSRLSGPEDVQLLPAYYYLDGSSAFYRRSMDTLALRPPSGTAGTVRVAYLAARLRKGILDGYRARGNYPVDFRRQPVPRFGARPARRAPRSGAALNLAFDLAPAETLLAIVSTPDVTVDEAMRRTSTPAFDALRRHRSQGFYPVALTRERLARNLALAASTRPVDRLYAYAQPLGLLHYAELREHAADYRALLDSLRAHEQALVSVIADSLAPYLPPGAPVSRTVSFYIADGADGWASQGVYAVDLEYVKDDYAGLLGTMLHETFHAVQRAARERRPSAPPPARTAADSLFAGALSQLWLEGTANFVAPATARTPAQRDSAAREGALLLDELYGATYGVLDRARAREIVGRGTSGGGPFYWLGAAMSETIVRRRGRQALAELLGASEVEFFEAYLRAAGRQEGWFSPRVAAAVRRLPR